MQLWHFYGYVYSFDNAHSEFEHVIIQQIHYRTSLLDIFQHNIEIKNEPNLFNMRQRNKKKKRKILHTGIHMDICISLYIYLL